MKMNRIPSLFKNSSIRHGFVRLNFYREEHTKDESPQFAATVTLQPVLAAEQIMQYICLLISDSCC